MTVPVLLHGALATHRRGRILQEALSATPSTELPDGPAVVLAFADAFQGAEEAEQVRLIEWTRVPGHLLLLLPPFAGGAASDLSRGRRSARSPLRVEAKDSPRCSRTKSVTG
ncbi:hypothetical protein ACU4HD_19525 [Cupriavidus basilensis]